MNNRTPSADPKMMSGRVALVAPPFIPLHSASLGVSLLKGRLNEMGMESRVFYCNFDYASMIGIDAYNRIASGEPSRVDLVGEWIFTSSLYESHERDDDGYIRDVLNGASLHHRKPNESESVREERNKLILELRNRAQDFIERCVESLLSYDPAIVGFSSIFHSHASSLAIAKALKRRRADITTLLGGSNCDGVMGRATAEMFPFVDAVVSGEADSIFQELIERILNKQEYAHLPGVHTGSRAPSHRLRIANNSISCAPTTDMNGLPHPDQTDYFNAVSRTNLRFENYERPHIAFEASRGCWWGEKHHCTFCGLNGSTIKFRSKTPDRAINELVHLVTEFPGYQVAVADCIMDHTYHGDFLDQLISKNLDLHLFFEVKSNLRKDQIKKMRQAGITRVQPGIESFSDEILSEMKKGVTGLQNIQTLKWCKELGVKTAWGLLWGFPKEDPKAYEAMAKLLPKISHLQAPEGMTQLRLDRFSPNFNFPDKFGFKNIRPFPSYSYVFPFSEKLVADIAYFFTYEYSDGRNPAEYVVDFVSNIERWQEHDHDCDLFYFANGSESIFVVDFRLDAVAPFFVLRENRMKILQLCDGIHSTSTIFSLLSPKGLTADLKMIESDIEYLIDIGMLLRDQDRLLSLPIAIGRYRPSEAILERFLVEAERVGVAHTGERIAIR